MHSTYKSSANYSKVVETRYFQELQWMAHSPWFNSTFYHSQVEGKVWGTSLVGSYTLQTIGAKPIAFFFSFSELIMLQNWPIPQAKVIKTVKSKIMTSSFCLLIFETMCHRTTAEIIMHIQNGEQVVTWLIIKVII